MNKLILAVIRPYRRQRLMRELEAGRPLSDLLAGRACQADPALAEELALQAKTIARLQAAPAAGPAAAFDAGAGRRKLETRLHAQNRNWQQALRRQRLLRQAFSLVLLLLVFLSVGNAAMKLNHAATAALPGEFLYQAKLRAEQVQLAFTFSTADQAHFHLTIAERRAAEFDALVIEGQYEYLSPTLSRLEAAMYSANAQLYALPRETQLSLYRQSQPLRDFLAYQQLMLYALQPSMPDITYSIIERVRHVAYISDFAPPTP